MFVGTNKTKSSNLACTIIERERVKPRGVQSMFLLVDLVPVTEVKVRVLVLVVVSVLVVLVEER